MYALNIGEGTGDVIVKDCTISGWTSFGNVGKTIITGTTFEEGDYNYLRFYQDAVIDGISLLNNVKIRNGDGSAGGQLYRRRNSYNHR